MKIDISTKHFQLDTKERDYVAEKIGRLEKFYNNIIKAQVIIDEQAGNTANVRYICKVTLSVPGQDLFAEESSRNVTTAVDFAEKKLKEQLFRLKDKSRPNPIHSARKWVRTFFGKEEQ